MDTKLEVEEVPGIFEAQSLGLPVWCRELILIVGHG